MEVPMKFLMNVPTALRAWTVEREALDKIGVWRQATVHVIVHHDVDSRPENDEALTAEHIEAWKRDEWFYGLIEVEMRMFGLTASEYIGGVGFGLSPKVSEERLAWSLAEDMIGVALVDMRRQIQEISRWAIAAGLGKEEA